MSKQRPTPKNPPLAVPTVQVQQEGFARVQSETAAEAIAAEAVLDARLLTDFPAQRNAEWAMPTFVANAVKGQASYRWVDVLLWGLFSWQAYFQTDSTQDILMETFRDYRFTRFSSVGPGEVGWDEYSLEGHRVLVFPGTENYSELLSYVGDGILRMAGQPPELAFFAGLVQVLKAYEDAVWAQYGGTFSIPQRTFLFAGHSLGGVVASWLAHRMNTRAGLAANEPHPVYAVFSYGAPAGWIDVTDQTDFLQWHDHFRVVAPGDPVPGIVQVVIQNSPWLLNRNGTRTFCPRHYESRIILIDGSRIVLSYERDLARNAIAQLLAGPAVARQAVKNHGAGSYCRQLMAKCRSVRDTPYPLFPRLDVWFSILATPGLAVR